MPILCATDFSETADRAGLLAAALAQKLGDRLVLLHATEPVTVALPYPVDPTGAIEVSIREAGETAIASAVDKLRGQGIDVTGRVAYGTAEASILDLAKELGAQLIVVGTHGRKGVARLFLGSVAAALAKSAPCPVVVCGAHPFDLAAWQAAAPVRLTLGFDATRASRAAMAWTGALPPALARTVTVVRPYWPAQEASRYGFDQLEASANAPADLVRLLERDLAQEIPASVEIEAGGTHFRQAHVNAAEILAETAVSLRANAIVIGVSGHGLERWDALDYRALLRNATVPVFCVPESVRVQAPSEEIPTYRSALIATDLSPESNRALAKGYGLLSPTGGRSSCATCTNGGKRAPAPSTCPSGPV
jgi:nucleotide-binding universal stress UspA family protein